MKSVGEIIPLISTVNTVYNYRQFMNVYVRYHDYWMSMRSFLMLLLHISIVITITLAEDTQTKNSSIQNGIKKRKWKKKKGTDDDVFLKFLSSKNNSSTTANYHGNVFKNTWCQDTQFCEQLQMVNTTFYQQQALCAQRWLFILPTLKGDSSIQYNHSMSSILTFLNTLKPTIIMNITNTNMNKNMEYLVDQFTFARRFKMYDKKLSGAWIQNPIDMKNLFLDLQKLFLYTLISTETLRSLHPQLSNKTHIVAAPVNNFLTRDCFLFLKAVFPCSRIIIHDINFHKAATVAISVDNRAANLGETVESLATKYFPDTSFIVGKHINVLDADQNSHSMHTMLNQLIKWLGIDVEDCKISNTICSNSDVRRISTGHCVEGECKFLNTESELLTVLQ